MRVCILLMFGAFFSSGCSVYEAIHAPSPVDYKHVRVGETRTETIAHLGYPKISDRRGDELTDSFEFMDGYHPASKTRIILYIAGDVFTACLSELIFWPIEMSVFDGKMCRATVTYGPDDHVKSYQVMDKKGKILWEAPLATPAAVPLKRE